MLEIESFSEKELLGFFFLNFSFCMLGRSPTPL